MSGRLKRNANAKPSRVSGALADLLAAREGGAAKRAAAFEVKEEEAVYDEVDEEQYEQLASKRRIETGDFIEDDNGDYMDLGDEDDLWKGGPAEAEAKAGGKKRKDASGKDGLPNKKKAVEADKDNKAKERMQAMFAKAAARPAAAGPKATDESSDAFLQSLLDDLGPGPSSATAPATRPLAARAAPPVTKTFVRPSARAAGTARPHAAAAAAAAAAAVRPVAGTATQGAARLGSRMPGASGTARPAAVVAHRQIPIMAHEEEEAPLTEDFGAGDDDGYDFSFDDPGRYVKDEPLASTSPFGKPADTATATAPAANGHTPGPSPLSALAAASDTTPGVPIKHEPSNGSGTDAAGNTANGATPAAAGQRSRLFAETPSSPAMLQACPATGWQEVCDAALDGAAAGGASPVPQVSPQASPEAAQGVKAEPGVEAAAAGLPVDKDGNLPFYFLDAHESQDRPDVLYLFGKVKAQDGRYQSCCVLVPNIHRSLLFVPDPSVFDDATGEIAALQQQEAADPSPENKVELMKLLHERSTDLKAEVRALLLKHGVKHMRMVPKNRDYAFEHPNVPHGKQWVLKVRYPSTEPQLPLGLSGTHFRAVFGSNQSLLEALLIKRRIKGPSWLLLKGAVLKSSHAMVSWCKLEVELPTGFKAITPAPDTVQSDGKTKGQDPAPPLTMASLTLKLHVDPASQTNEILSASVVHLSGVPVDAPMSQAQWNSPQALRNFSIVRKLQGRPWPPGFEQLASAENASPRGKLNGGAMVLTQANERALLTCLLAKLQALDADVLVGHNISAFDLNVLLHRLQLHKVPLWSRIGRLKRNNFPKLTGGGHVFGGGASPGVTSCLAGRLLCDTYLSARELVKEVDYTLKTLASSLLGQARHELPAAELLARFDSAQGLRSVMAHGESDAWLALGLVFHLSVLPLTKQLTNLSGSLWSRTLQGQRAARIEMLLLHEFHAHKFMLPDKLSLREKGMLSVQQERQGKQKKGKAGKKIKEEEDEGPQQPDGPPDEDEDMQEDGQAEDEPGAAGAKAAAGGGRGKNKPQYAGGLVLEPKKGLYDSIVIMLDFNSLYPSIIQEYNICFTTVQRPKDGGVPPLPESLGKLAPLPTVIQGLVQKRRQVKGEMAAAGRQNNMVQYQQLNIKQQAIKLTANSMYGCLGFTNSRFYAKPLAELVTSQGREILQSTVDLVQTMDDTNVIYGDTDSIMIHTATHDVAAAKGLGEKIKLQVNKRYKLLEIELDAVYKCMLLLKKKKYAAIKLGDGPNGGEVLEAKGLDIVRRDWCPLSKEAGSYALNQILSGKPKEEVVEAVHEHLRSVAAAMDAGEVPLNQFIITKQLTKRPEDYPDARNQPHVQVALRRRAAGKRDGVASGETVPYIICVRIDKQQQHQDEQQQPEEQQQQQAGASPSQPNGNAGASPLPASSAQQPEGADPTASPSLTADAALPNGNVTPSPPAQPPASTSNTQAPASGTPSRGMGKKAAAAAKGHLADRAYHPDELREDSTLAIDIDYYKGQQVHPVVSRLCMPIEGTDAAHLAECLGLEGSKFGGAQAVVHRDMAADLREEALQVTGSLLDDDAHYTSCEPLTLTAPNGTPFPFAGVRALLRSDAPIEYGLNPPDAIGDPEQAVSAARLANQAVLAARALVVQYYAGDLVSDDEMAAGSGRDGSSAGRDVCLRQVEGSAVQPGSVPAPSGGAVLTRALGEDRLYTTLSHYVRLLDVRAALDTISEKGMKEEARQRLAPIAKAMEGAAAAVARLRDASGYRWVDLGALFGSLRARLG